MSVRTWRIPSNSLNLRLFWLNTLRKGPWSPSKGYRACPEFITLLMESWLYDVAQDFRRWKLINTFLNILPGGKKSSLWQFWRKQAMTLKTYQEPLANTHHKKNLNFYQGFKACLWQGNCRKRGRNRRWIQREFGNKWNISDCIRLESKAVLHTNIHSPCTSKGRERRVHVKSPLWTFNYG